MAEVERFECTLEQFFLTVGQNNFGNKIPLPWYGQRFSLIKMHELRLKSIFLRLKILFAEFEIIWPSILNTYTYLHLSNNTFSQHLKDGRKIKKDTNRE